MSKRIAAIVLAVTIISLAVAPETQAQRRRDCNRSVSSRYYGSNSNYGVAGQRYYASPYVGSNYGSSYYNGTRYVGQPYYGRVAGTRYYGQDYYRGYRNRNSTRNTVLTISWAGGCGRRRRSNCRRRQRRRYRSADRRWRRRVVLSASESRPTLTTASQFTTRHREFF